MKKVISLILLAALALPFCACSETAESGSSETTAATASVTDSEAESVDEEAALYADVPTDDYGGYEFRILNTDSNYAYTLMDTEELDGEIINDSVYNRNAAVESALNITITETVQPFGSKIASAIKNAVSANEDAYDIMFDECQFCWSYISQGMMQDLKTFEALELDKPWWNKGSVDTLTIKDRLYFVNGDLHLMYGESAWVLMFNKPMCADNSLETPYQTVRDGKWTFDEMYRYMTAVANDADGDSKLTTNDRFGLATHGDSAIVGLISTGQTMLEKNSDGVPEWNGMTDSMLAAFDRISTVWFNNDAVLQDGTIPVGSENVSGIIPHFMAGKSLFLMEVLGHVKTLREMDADFGLLPTPKLDESQEDYHTFVARSAHTLMVPVTNPDTKRTAVILENMGAESYKSLRPAYYEVQISGKSMRDPESLDMLDIIFDGRTYEPAYVFGADTIGSMFITACKNGADLASTLEKSSKATRKQLEKSLKFIIEE